MRTEPRGSAPLPLAVIDIDGVVADVRHRVHHVRKRPKDWERFFAAAPEDPAHPEGLSLLREVSAEAEVVFLTGRPESCRRETEEWLASVGWAGARVVMRPAGDRRPAAQLKLELLHRLADGREVSLVVDDDPVVVEAVRASGYPVRLADWETRSGASERALREAQEGDGRT